MPVPLDILLRGLLVVATIITLTRIHGLRSFSKMAAFDFSITVAVGSVLAGAITTLSTPVWHFAIALVVLFVLQIGMAQARLRWSGVAAVLDNAPLLIMENQTPIDANLAKGGMTRADLFAKLREANAFDLKEVHAVILESTGDVSVLHGPADGSRPSQSVLDGVRRD